jgi:type IV pilus assembly protein PilA
VANKSQQLAQLFIATDISHKLRSALDLGIVISLIMLLTVLALVGYETHLARSQLAEAFMLASTVKSEIVAYRAEHGDWPASNENLHSATLGEKDVLGKFVHRMQLEVGGSLTTLFNTTTDVVPHLSGRRLTMRPMVLPGSPGSPVFWACSAYRAPEGFIPSGADQTDIDIAQLPVACREY